LKGFALGALLLLLNTSRVKLYILGLTDIGDPTDGIKTKTPPDFKKNLPGNGSSACNFFGWQPQPESLLLQM
jgi:hypothetical protein